MADIAVSHRIEAISADSLENWLARFRPDDYEQLSRRLGNLLIVLDELEDPPVDAASWPPRMTSERRSLALDALALPDVLRAEVDRRNPLPTPTLASPLVWVDPDVRPSHRSDYVGRTKQRGWTRYRRHLEDGMSWPASDTDGMERDLDDLVTAFPDPEVTERSPRRLLVVGFTQSGKTANFIGLATRMADVGVRLFVILSGRTKLLRRQTQARVDRDLIGSDPLNVGVLQQEYGEGHRLLSRLAQFEPSRDKSWIRLTQHRYGRDIGAPQTRVRTDDDAYQRPMAGLAAANPNSPMVAVLKKTPGDLQTFLAALEAAPAEFRAVPAIVIDEEADDASLNYRARRAPRGGWAPVVSAQERSAVNRLISQLVGKLDRGVYVGYTATPFASCFADADDVEGFFPNAIQVLQTPRGYFGAPYVFDALYQGPVGALDPTAAHVREIQDDNGAQAELDDALDDWLIAGAIKLFRMERASALGDTRAVSRLRHHSMMVHIGTQRQIQRNIRQETRDRLIRRAGRGLAVMSPDETAARLRNRFERDFRLVSLSLTGLPGRLPTRDIDTSWVPTWAELVPLVKQATEHILAEDRRERVVLLVNSDEDREAPEYDAEDSPLGRWCIVVGGHMLSRGFTVEGLTTVYFRRTASAMDTQLQLARWNGYRSYFEDLVRIYFGVSEGVAGGHRHPRNLLSEFTTSALTDARFRETLRRYGEEGTSPRLELPAFAEARGDSALRPTAPGKMRGVVRQTGAPIEVGRRGQGLTENDPTILDLALHTDVTRFASQTVCDQCEPAAKESMVVATGHLKGTLVQGLLDRFGLKSAGPSGDDMRILVPWLAKDDWRLAFIGMIRDPDAGTVDFGSLKVPVRIRTLTEYDTLSTGQWNRWMRVATGENCEICGRPTADAKPLVVLLPYTTATPGAQPVWGAMLQVPGRAGSSGVLVTGPSRRRSQS